MPMLFDDLELYHKLDPDDMLGEINRLPAQLNEAWELGKSLPLPDWSGFTRVVAAGVGGSAIGADLLVGYSRSNARVPIIVHRDYGLPAWAAGPETLLIVSSHSGNTEEVLSAYEAGVEQGCRILCVTTGGELGQRAAKNGHVHWSFSHSGQPRAAVGYSFMILLAALARLGLVGFSESDLEETVQAMRDQQIHLVPETPTVENPAKRYAGQLMGRWFTVFGAEHLAPVARRWKGQVNELAKAWAQFEVVPEANHNALAGTANPEQHFGQSMALFLTASRYHPRNSLRMAFTRKTYMLEGIPTDHYQAVGRSTLAQIWTTLHFGDYMAYYLAIAYGTDPTPVHALIDLKHELRQVDS
jgi:glucose/mannose-6-phosphate isomerase